MKRSDVREILFSVACFEPYVVFTPAYGNRHVWENIDNITSELKKCLTNKTKETNLVSTLNL